MVIEEGVDGDGEVSEVVDGGVFEVMEVGYICFFNNGCNTILSLIIVEKCVVISGNEECWTNFGEVDKEVLGDENAFWGELVFGVEEVTGDCDNFVSS